MERAIDGDDIALGDKLLETGNTADTKKLLKCGIKRLFVLS